VGSNPTLSATLFAAGFPMTPVIRIAADLEELSRAAAEEFARRASGAVGERGVASVALCGGSTPRRLYALLADEGDSFRVRVPWGALRVYWGDERHVPPDHPDSNYRMTREAMLSHVPVLEANVHRIRAEKPDAAAAAEDYERTLWQTLGEVRSGAPRFDLVLLGMGADGHVASLFPGSEALREPTRLVVAPWVEALKTHRITLTPRMLNNAACLLVMVAGEDKAEAVRAALEGPRDSERHPAQILRPRAGDLLWLIDRAAARLLSA
jgi:6-phosphogluconolactonase